MMDTLSNLNVPQMTESWVRIPATLPLRFGHLLYSRSDIKFQNSISISQDSQVNLSQPSLIGNPLIGLL